MVISLQMVQPLYLLKIQPYVLKFSNIYEVRSYMAKKETEELEEPTLEDLEEEDIEEIETHKKKKKKRKKQNLWKQKNKKSVDDTDEAEGSSCQLMLQKKNVKSSDLKLDEIADKKDDEFTCSICFLVLRNSISKTKIKSMRDCV